MANGRFTTSPTQRNAVVVIATVVAGAAIYWLRGILTPFALAFFLLIMIDGMARWLQRRIPRLKSWAAMPLALGLVLVAFGFSVFIVADNIASFAGQLNSYLPRLNAMIADVGSLFGFEARFTVAELIQRLQPERFIGAAATAVQEFAGDALLVLIYLGFMLASRRSFARKLDSLFVQQASREEAGEIFFRIREGVEKYLWVQTVTGLMISFGCWLVMTAVGLEQALFWAFFIFLTGYIPVVGAAVGTILPAVFALVQFQSYVPAAVVFAGTQSINFVVGNFIYPRMQGQSLNVDALALLLALAFWSALWGLTGAFLATPLLVTAMVLLAQFDGTRWIAVLISENGQPLGEERGRRKQVERSPPSAITEP